MSTMLASQLAGQKFFCSWSGGKDSCLALHRATQAGGHAERLLTIIEENGARSRSHTLPLSLLNAQANSLGLPASFQAASWADYEGVFIKALRQLKTEGLSIGVFGDIDVEAHRQWVWKVCAAAGITPVHPLWQEDRRALMEEFINAGFQARVVVVNESMLPTSFLGKSISRQTILEMEQAGIDPCGELGEYHSVVTAGPLFREPLNLRESPVVHHEGYAFLPVDIA